MKEIKGNGQSAQKEEMNFVQNNNLNRLFKKSIENIGQCAIIILSNKSDKSAFVLRTLRESILMEEKLCKRKSFGLCCWQQS